MDKKKSVMISAVAIVVVTIILAGYLLFKNSQKVTSPLAKIQPTPTIAEEMATWTDPADFNFQYPKSLSLNPHNEDQTSYAHVELTSATHSGSLIVWVKDTSADTIDNWVTQTKVQNAIDSNLAGVPAKKVLTTGDVNKLMLSAIQNGYLYQVEADLADSDFWNKTLDTVTSTFKFTSANKASSNQTPNTSTDQGTTDTGSADEEVIE